MLRSSLAFWLLLVAALSLPSLAISVATVQASSAPNPTGSPTDQAQKSSDDEEDEDEESIEGEGEEAEGEEADEEEAKSDESEAEESASDDEKSAEEDAKSDEAKDDKSDDEAEKKPQAAEEKTDEKADDKKSSGESDEKPDAKKAAAEKEGKKPETFKVEAKAFKIEVEAEGVFVAEVAAEVALRPEAWAAFKVVEAVPHGDRVRKGDVLVKFDDKDIEKALAEKSLELRTGELALMAAEEDFPRLEKSIALSYDEAKRQYDEAQDEKKRFDETMRDMSERMAKYYLQSSEQQLQNANEEYEQLKKMYDADELTEETEEIVLKRQKFEVEAAKFFLEYAKINHQYTTEISIPPGPRLGDKVLEATACAIQAVCRRDETAARIGGEEFAVILPGADAETARAVGERIRQAIAARTVKVKGHKPLSVTASVGVASTRGGSVDSAEALYTAADRALYSSKQSGRDRTSIATPPPPSSASFASVTPSSGNLRPSLRP